MSTATASPVSGNGKKISPAMRALADATAYEQAIAEEAAALRGPGEPMLTPEMLVKLLPLLRRPIPDGFISSTPAVKGKPYDSTGIKSVQVQIDRMDNVLTPLGWTEETTYSEGGKLAEVVVSVIDPDGKTLFKRKSMGGVNQASTTGNLYKGSYTNAAKRAFAMVGPGHEVYLGATDLDPDVNPQAATEQAPQQPAGQGIDEAVDAAKIDAKRAKQLVDLAWSVGVQDKLQLAASHALGGDVGDCSVKAKATAALAKLTVGQADKVEHWLSRKADEKAASDA